MLLDERKAYILESVVSDYVLTSRPVGSDRLIEAYRLSCRSATVRNELADLADMGYLAQPHTSAGRIPTDLGYRFYVDERMDQSRGLAPEEARAAQRAASLLKRGELEEIVQETLRVLSRITCYACIATDPSAEAATLRRIWLSEADARHALLVLLISTGHVEHRLLDLQGNYKALAAISTYINHVVAGRSLDEIPRLARNHETDPAVRQYGAAIRRVLGQVAQAASNLSDRRLFLEGTSQLLRQPEFQDIQRLETLISALEKRSALCRILRRAGTDDVTVLIGAEIDWAPMQDCAVVSQSYRIGTRTAGFLGVVGPTRMRYDRATAAVHLMAQSLSAVLTNLSLA